MTDINSIFLYNIPKFEKRKIYPVNHCDLCCDISVIEYCPLKNCDYKMCALCWNKIINDSNICPVCRREFPMPRDTCYQYIEYKCIENIDNIQIISIIISGIIMTYIIVIFCLM